MTIKRDNIWFVGNIPFVWTHPSKPQNNLGIPNTLPFTLIEDEKTNVLHQLPIKETKMANEKIYSIGSSISGQMSDAGIGKKYADDFIKFLFKIHEKTDMNGLRILEIGCGNGYLLCKLKKNGADVVGIEPGKFEEDDASFCSTEIIKDFFPSDKIAGNFDIIIAYAVLEHINNTFAFFDSVKNLLNSNGILLLAVPDCKPYIDHGDISMLFHEHWNYYNEDSLRRTLYLNNGTSISIEKAGFGGVLYASCEFKNNDTNILNLNSTKSVLPKFKLKALKNNRRLEIFIKKEIESNKIVGIYIPSRFISFYSIHQIPNKNLRFFDDNQKLHGTYFPGIDIAIESWEDLIKCPVDTMIIFSHTFGSKIVLRIKNQFSSRITIKQWYDFYS